MIRNPEYFVTKGLGKLNSDRFKIDISFEIFLINQKIAIYCYQNEYNPISLIDKFKLMGEFDKYFSITGITEKNENIQAINLIMTALNDKFIELISNSQIVIGSYFEPFAEKIIYSISNLFGYNFNLEYNGFKIEVASEINSIKENISKFWEIPQVASRITLSKEIDSVENYTLLINHFFRLLSLGTGRQLSFGKQHLYQKDKDFTILQNNFSSHKGVREIIPSNRIKDFVLLALPIIKEWNSDEFKDFKMILEYLNVSDDGYLDDRLFMLIQSWEVFANTWFLPKYKLPGELEELKKSIKPILEKWHNEYPNFDNDRFWDGRIYDSLKWDKTIKIIENTLNYFNLDNKKLNLNIEKLVRLRHLVAHKGRFGNSDDENINDIISCQFSLRLLLLKLFGYNGEVIDYRDVTKTHGVKIVSISEFEFQ
jgi:hypothetical protein